jgi:hypothetical protein
MSLSSWFTSPSSQVSTTMPLDEPMPVEPELHERQNNAPGITMSRWIRQSTRSSRSISWRQRSPNSSPSDATESDGGGRVYVW